MSGIGYDYVWGFTFSLGMLVIVPFLLIPTAVPPSRAAVEGVATVGETGHSRDRWRRRYHFLGMSTSVPMVLVIAVLVAIPTGIYYIQPTAEFPESDLASHNQALRVPQAAIDLAAWMSTHLPANSIFMAPPDMWYLSALTGHISLAETYAQADLSTPRIDFLQDFYVGSLDSIFSNPAALSGWANGTVRTGIATISSNQTFQGQPVLQITRQAYSAYYHAADIPLDDALLRFTVYPTATPVEPYDVLGVTLRLASGQELSFQQNWNQSSESMLVDPISLNQSEWNTISVNVTAIAETFPELNSQADIITNVSLGGGVDDEIYWASVSLGPDPVPLGRIMTDTNSFGVGYIVADSGQANSYVGALAACGFLEPLYTASSFTLYEVQEDSSQSCGP